MAKDGAVSFQASGQVPGAASQEQQQGNETQQPKYVTVEEAQRLADEAANKVLRQAQSFFDQNSNKFTKEVRGRLDSLESAWKIQEAAGVTITDEQKKQIRQQVITDAATAPEQGQQQPPPTQVSGGDPDDPAVVNRKVGELYQRYGAQVFEGEPEAADLDYSSGAAFISSLEVAIQKKQARLSGGAQQAAAPQTNRTPTNAGATGSVPRPDLQAQYNERMKQIPRGDVARISDLKKEFRGKGLDVW